jgi:uncharacterized protein (UPF0264 family)
VRLLVSVRNADEAAAALAGGADIVDAKEPAHGALGMPSRAALEAIARAVPSDVPLSIALGDPSDAGELGALIRALPLEARIGAAAPTYVKLGLARAASRGHAIELLADAVRAGAAHPARLRVIAAAYADAREGSAAAPPAALDAAVRVGVAGILVDTADKQGAALPALLAADALVALTERVRAAGLVMALAGRLSLDDMRVVATSGADIIGVRGAACDGGRDGRVSAARVALLRRRAHCQLGDEPIEPSDLLSAEHR